mgnify:CR=1 FL=1
MKRPNKPTSGKCRSSPITGAARPELQADGRVFLDFDPNAEGGYGLWWAVYTAKGEKKERRMRLDSDIECLAEAVYDAAVFFKIPRNRFDVFRAREVVAVRTVEYRESHRSPKRRKRSGSH